MASVLITTSRRTSNRIRSFIRDLSVVLPDSERFNRGGTSRSELVARIKSSGARAALVVTMYKGNPGRIHVVMPSGEDRFIIYLEAAVLRREVCRGLKQEVSGLSALAVKYGSSGMTQRLGELVGTLLDWPAVRSERVPVDPGAPAGAVVMWFQDLRGERTLWTHYSARDGTEVGPRIRVRAISGPP